LFGSAFPSCCGASHLDDCEKSANHETIQKAKSAEMCANKKEPPSSDGPVIGKQNRFCPTLQLTTPILKSNGSGGGSSFFLALAVRILRPRPLPKSHRQSVHQHSYYDIVVICYLTPRCRMRCEKKLLKMRFCGEFCQAGMEVFAKKELIRA
jgi:hypothetical protein